MRLKATTLERIKKMTERPERNDAIQQSFNYKHL